MNASTTFLAAGLYAEAIEAYGNAVRLGSLTSDPVVRSSARKLRDVESRLQVAGHGPSR